MSEGLDQALEYQSYNPMRFSSAKKCENIEILYVFKCMHGHYCSQFNWKITQSWYVELIILRDGNAGKYADEEEREDIANQATEETKSNNENQVNPILIKLTKLMKTLQRGQRMGNEIKKI